MPDESGMSQGGEYFELFVSCNSPQKRLLNMTVGRVSVIGQTDG